MIGSLKLTPVSAVIPDGLTFEEWRELPKQFGHLKSKTHLYIGDWLVYGEQNWPRDQIFKVAGEITGLGRHLSNLLYTCRQVPPQRRLEKLDWAHFYQVAKLDPESQSYWLSKAKAGGWTVPALRSAINEEDTELSVAEVAEEPEVGPEAPVDERVSTRHTQMQHLLLKLGHAQKYQLWVAPGDRTKSWQGQKLGDMPGVMASLPYQWSHNREASVRAGRIDVLWLKNDVAEAAFEVEESTPIYSGLLRMSDLYAFLLRGLTIDLYVVASEVRRKRVQQEVYRPTFRLPEIMLSEKCRLITFERLEEKMTHHSDVLNQLTYDFVRNTLAETIPPPADDLVDYLDDFG